VSLQESVLRAVHAEFSWPLAPRFPDVRGAVTEKMRQVTQCPDDWVWDADPPLALAWDEQRRLHLAVGGSFVEIIAEDVEAVDLVPAARRLVPEVADLLGVTTVTAVEVTLIWLTASEDRSTAAAELESKVLVAGARDLFEPLGGRPDHVEVAAEFGAGAPTVSRLDVRSLSAEEMMETPEFLSPFAREDLPPAALRVRLHRRQRGDLAVAESLDRMDYHLDAAVAAGRRFLGTLLSP
jgi:hypothetical protein